MEEASVMTVEESRQKPAFEEVLDAIDSRGKFQRRLNIIYNCVAVCCSTMSSFLYALYMQTPDHWCHVPGREYTNYSLHQWKNITIPKDGDSFSKCTMYNTTSAAATSQVPAVPCQHGWDYDDTWFSVTVPSQMDWVCGDQHIVNDVMFYSQNIAVALGLLLGYIGDMFGRRPQYFLCLGILAVSRLTMVLTPSIPVLFTLVTSLMAAASGPLGESSLSVCLELADIRQRVVISLHTSICVAFGMLATGVVAWLLPVWNYCFLLASFCYLALFSFFRWFPESPRWLACRGREQEALRVLRRIADTNGRTVPPFVLQVLHSVGKAKTERKGFLSLFSSWNLLKNTLLLVFARSVFVLTVMSLLLTVGSLSVNPFATIAAQGAAQIPAFFAVHYCARSFGRRWSSVASAFLTSVAAAAVVVLLTGGLQGIVLTAAAIIMSFFATAFAAVVNLQSAEVHPTCLRQIAVCIEWAVAGIVLSLLPHLVFLGGSVDQRIPFVVLSVVNLVVAVSVSFLPESALQRLPETLEDAAAFGKQCHYWSWRPKPAQLYVAE